MPALVAHLNRDRPRALDAPAEFTARQPFDVVFENHGDGSNVHLHVDDELSRVLRLTDGNLFVGSDGTGRVRADVASVEEPVSGTLTVSLGYGAQTASIRVTVAPYQEPANAVTVDEALGKPQRTANETASRTTPEPETIALVLLGLVALAAAVAVATFVNSPVVTAGAAVVALAVVIGVGVALR